jgi:hypothetical protein
LRQKDPVAFAEQYTDFSHGAYEIFGPEYREAYEHRQFVTSVLGQQEKIFNWIEDRCAKGLPPSIEAIDQQASGMVEAEQLVSGHIAPWVYAGLAARKCKLSL